MVDMAADGNVSLQQAILQHGGTIEDGKITYKFETGDGSSFQVKIKKESPSKTGNKISPKSVKEKLKNVLPWTKHHDHDNIGITQSDQVYGEGCISEPIYEEIAERDGVYDVPNTAEKRFSTPAPLPSSPTSPAKSSASLPDSYKTPFVSADAYDDPCALRGFHPRVGDTNSPYYGHTLAINDDAIDPSKIQHYDVPTSPSEGRKDDEIRTRNITCPYYSRPPADENIQIPDDNTYMIPTVTDTSCTENVLKIVDTEDIKKCIPRDITCTTCDSVDSDEWDKLCDEYSDYTCQEDINENNNETKTEYVTMRPSVKLKGRTPVKGRESVENEKPKPKMQSSPTHHIPVDISNTHCPNTDEDTWDMLCEELFD